MSWQSAGADRADIGATNASRITLSGDAQGTWSLAVTEAFNPHARFTNNPIINGQMVLAPLQGDLNFDGFVGIQDLNWVLGAWNQSVSPGSRPDPSADGFVGIADLNVVLGNWNAGPVPLQPGSQSGVFADLNSDGLVGMDDLNIVVSNWYQNVPPGDLLSGDPSGNGFVGAEDSIIVRHNWGDVFTPPGSSASVPEPATTAMLFLMLCVFSCERGRR